MPKVELHTWKKEDGSAAFTAVLDGAYVDANADPKIFQPASVVLSAEKGGVLGSATLRLKEEVGNTLRIDARLLVIIDEAAQTYAFKSLKQLADGIEESVYIALTQARRELAEKFRDFDIQIEANAAAGATFFGAGAVLSAGAAVTLDARCSVRPSMLLEGAGSDDGIAVQVHAEASVSLITKISDSINTSATNDLCRWLLDVEVRREDIPRLALALEAPVFDLRWPKLEFPVLSLNGLTLPELDGLLHLPSWRGAQLPRVVWTPAPVINVAVDEDGVVSLVTSAEGKAEVFFQNSKAFDVEGFAINLDNGSLQVKATLKAGGTIALTDISETFGPLAIKTAGGSIEYAIALDGGNFQLSAICGFDSVQISDKDDASLVIAAAVKFAVRVNQKGAISTEVLTLELVQPYPIKLLAKAAQAAGNVIRLLASIPLPLPQAPSPDIADFLKRLERLLAAVIRWLAQKAGQALVGIAEAVKAALQLLFNALTNAADAVLRHVAIEICLDPGTFRLVQISIMPGHTLDQAPEKPIAMSALGVELSMPRVVRPTLILRFEPDPCAALVVWLNDPSELSLGTDLWLTSADGSQQAVADTPSVPNQGTVSRLLQVSAKLKDVAKPIGIALAVVSRERRRAEFFRKVAYQLDENIDCEAGAFRVIRLSPAARFEPLDSGDLEIKFALQEDRILNLLGRSADADEDSSSGQPDDSLLKQLSQYVVITSGDAQVAEDNEVTIPFDVELKIAGSKIATQLALRVRVDTLAIRLEGADNLKIRGPARTHQMLGFELHIAARKPEFVDDNGDFNQLMLSFRDGDASLRLAPEASAELTYKKVSRQGRGLVFAIDDFGVSRGGLDLAARITQEPVILSGVNTPFRFTSGALAVKRGKLLSASIAGSGQLPPKLVGEATAEVAIGLGRGKNGDLVVESAMGVLKLNSPLVCEGTRFRFQIDELGFSFAYDDDGYHFYFLLSGEASFRPGSGEFRSGLMSNLSKTRIILHKVPLAGDGKALARCIEFQVPIDPPVTANLFNIFKFQLKGIGFHPASPAFGGAAAMSISGQIGFVPSGDVPNVKIDLHQLWIAPPKSGESLPRIRCDGLGLEVRAGSGTKMSALAIAVDENTPSLLTGIEPGSGVVARGFLAKGRLEISGWAPVRASMGFLELRKQVDGADQGPPRHAFFVFGQQEQLSQEICVFGYNIYLQEVGFGFGFRYTLAGIAEADTVTTPRALVRVLDEVSKYQGNLHEFKAWRPEIEGNRMTLAMRVMFSLTTASPGGEWNADAEKELPANPLLFDIVAALRSDLTFLMTGRAWLCRTYGDWTFSDDAAPWKERPMMRGYLYLSVPRQTLLARTLADGTGEVGEHPPLFGPLKKALEVARWSSTLYVAPGIFHQEFGWPYELGFTLENGHKFRLVVEAGLIIRIAEGALLYGAAFRAKGHSIVGGRAGSSRLGASAESRAEFAIEAKLIAYISARRLGDTFFYGLLSIDVAVSFRVCVWLQVKIFRKRIRFEVGFSFGLSLSIALEAVIGASSPFIGARARVAIGVRAFGRNLSVGVGVKFNDGYLTEARARVQRFMSLGLGVDTPDPAQGLNTAPAPLPEPSRAARAAEADQRIGEDAKRFDDLGGYDPDVEPASDTDGEEETVPPLDPDPATGVRIRGTNYWAVIHPTSRRSDEAAYILQLIPRDESTIEGDVKNYEVSTFFASPPNRPAEGELTEAREFDHRLVAEGDDVLPELHRLLLREGEEGDPVGKGTKAIAVEWEEDEGDLCVSTTVEWNHVPQPDMSEDLTLGHILGDCFLARYELDDGQSLGSHSLPFTDPWPRHSSDKVAPPDPQKAGSDLHTAARSRELLNGALGDSAVVEERRSALVGIIAESAARLASTGMDPSMQIWPDQDREGIDCRYLGLTFWVTRSELEELFSQKGDEDTRRWRAKFKVATAANRYVDSGSSDEKPTEFDDRDPRIGDVVLLNPPERFFAEAQPTLARQKVRTTPSGVALDWDLEPAWGSSASVFDDPEYLLKHYRIERRILEATTVQPRTLTIKPAAPMEYSRKDTDANGGGAGSYDIKLMRPNYQFIDDFSDVPPPLRAALLHLSGAVEDRDGSRLSDKPVEAWESEFPGFASVRVIYNIVPVDLAGTEADATIIEQSIERPEKPSRKLKQAQLAVQYKELVDAAQVAARPQLMLTVFADRPSVEESPVFVIRVRRSLIQEGGTFGDDHVPPSDHINTDADGELQQSDDLDFVVVLDPATPPAELITVQYRLVRPDGSLDDVPFKARIYPASRWDESKQPASLKPPTPGDASFADALGLTANQSSIVSVRLFARHFLPGSSLQQRKGIWRMVDMTLQVKSPVGGEPVTDGLMIDVQVERFERPAKASFRAMDRSDMSASAGRLHSQHPATEAELEALLDRPGTSLSVFRDPGRRSGVRLHWNAYPAELSYAGTLIEPPRGMIGGFDLFSWNPDALPPAGAHHNSPIEAVVQHSQYLGRIGILPESLRGIVPAESGELSRVEAKYPSETWRLKPTLSADEVQSGAGPVHARGGRWFSASDSILVWPNKMLRRQLLPLPDEIDITRCFAAGRPESVEAQFEPSVHVWSINEPTICSPSVEALRQWLRKLRWEAEVPGKLDDEFARNPKAFEGIQLTLCVFKNCKVATSITIPLEFTGRHHAVLEELLTDLRYTKDADSSYRRYEPVVENPPKISSSDWLGFLEETAVAADPYGWGVLRYFGLAACLRLYDTETGNYLDGAELARRINNSLDTVIARYSTECQGGQLGAPFVELVTHPNSLFQVASFDGGNPPADENQVLEELCAFVQVSLRPAPQRLIGAEMNHPSREACLAAHYFELRFNKEEIGPDDAVHLGGVELQVHSASDNGQHPAHNKFEVLLMELELSGRQLGQPTTAVLHSRPTEELDLPLEGIVERVVVDSAGFKENDLFAVGRLTVIGDGHGIVMENLSTALGSSIPQCLTLRWIRHPTEATTEGRFEINSSLPFERFAPPPAELMALLLGGWTDRAAHEAWPAHREWAAQYRRLATWGRAFADAAPEREALLGNLVTEVDKEKFERRWVEIAKRLAPWSERFLQHTLAQPLRFDDEGDLRIPFALATVPQPDPWRVPVQRDGTVDVLLLEKDRFGKRIRYALRPYGRYTSFEEAELRTLKTAEESLVGTDTTTPPSVTKSLAPTLEDALDAPGNFKEFEPWIEVSLPRTERVSTPVILSTRRVLPASAAEPTKSSRLELVIGRPDDEILADSNTAVEAAVNSQGVGLEFKREYTAGPWTQRIGETEFDPVDPLEDLPAQLPGRHLPELEWSRDPEVATLRERVPDLWRGAVAYSFADLPYFYRTHVLVHAAAGVMVSDHAVATFAEGDCVLGWPREPGTDGTVPPQDLGWYIAATGPENAHRALVVRIPLLRFVDCMTAAQLRNWSRPNNIPKAFFVPDPAIHYRLALVTPLEPADKGDAALSSEIELRPVDASYVPAAQTQPAFYYGKAVGRQFADPPESSLLPILGAPLQLWLEVPLQAPADEDATLPVVPPYAWPEPWNEGAATFDKLLLTPVQISVTRLHLPTRTVKISIDHFTAGNIAAIQQKAAAAITAVGEVVNSIEDHPWSDDSAAGLKTLLAVLDVLAELVTDNPDQQWSDFVDANLGGTVSGNTYLLEVRLPAGQLLQLPTTGSLRQEMAAEAWKLPENPPHRFPDRQALDGQLAMNGAQGIPLVDEKTRRLICSSLRARQIARSRREFEYNAHGFRPLVKGADPAAGKPAQWKWSEIDQATFDATCALRVPVPATRADLEALIARFDRIPSCIDALVLLGKFEDMVGNITGQVTLTLEVPLRFTADFHDFAVEAPLSRFVLRRPATAAELAAISHDGLKKTIETMTHEQVFGEGRYPILQVFRSQETPLRASTPRL